MKPQTSSQLRRINIIGLSIIRNLRTKLLPPHLPFLYHYIVSNTYPKFDIKSLQLQRRYLNL